MQTTDQAEPPSTREDFEEAIEHQKELISEEKYALRWAIRNLWLIWVSVAMSVVFFTAAALFPVIGSVFGGIGAATTTIAVLSAITFLLLL